MLGKGYDAKAIDNTGRTTLSLAADANTAAAIEFFAATGVDVDVDAADDSGKTALHYAAASNTAAAVSALITAGADVSIAAQDGATALDLATERGDQADTVAALTTAAAK